MSREDLLILPFDHYHRYQLTERLVRLLWPRRARSQELRVLDVGGHSSPLKRFLPDARVVLTDPEPPGSATSVPLRFDAYVRSSGARLPFRDRTFDLVTALDTLEHVAPGDRALFVEELFRVSRRFVVLNGPVRLPEVEKAEERLSRFLSRVLSEESRFLKEHRDLGLPSPEDIEAILQRSGVPFVKVPNGNLVLWLTVNMVGSYLRTLPQSEALQQAVQRTYNLLQLDQDYGTPSYRLAYVAGTSARDVTALERVREAFEPLVAGGPGLDVLETLDSAFAELERHGATFGATVEGLERSVNELRQAFTERDLAYLELESRYEELTRSSWHQAARRLYDTVNRVAPFGTRRRTLVHYAARSIRIIFTEGWRAFFRRLLRPRSWAPGLLERRPAPEGGAPLREQYRVWLRRNAHTPEQLKALRREGDRLGYRPTVSVVMPVYNTDPAWLREAIESVRRQLYDRWELCIGDDGSTRPETQELLRAYAEEDPRIRVTHLPENRGIVAASNAALAQATGEFVGLLDHDDELKPEALLEVVKVLNERPELDYIYTDEDKRDRNGELVEPFFKPDWSPDLLMSVNYVTHFSVYRKELVERLGGFRPGYDGSQDYDLVLRMAEATDRIAHIPKPLYTWRKAPGSAAASDTAKPFAYEAAKRAIDDALRRRGLQGRALDGAFLGYYRVRYDIPGSPRVALIIPTRDKVDMLRRCVASIRQKSTYRNYEIIVVDNDSKEPETLSFLSSLDGRVLRFPHEFNFSKIVNFAAKEAEDFEYLLFLNNDTEVISGEWIEAMLEHAQRPEVAVVGGRLLFPDGRPQHEGILVGPGGGLAGNIDHLGYFGLGRCIQNVSAVTAACMLVRRERFHEVGGFDERLRVAYNDVDFCLRAREKGYLVVYTPYAMLYHHEGGTRGRTGRTHPVEDEDLFRRRWGAYRDVYYNPNLDLNRPYRLNVT